MLKNRHFINIVLFLAVLLIVSPQTNSFSAEALTVQARVDKEKVTVGESLTLQIKIDGDESPAEPDLTGLRDFAVVPKGGGRNNRESITIINGKMNRISEHGYIFNYELTPKHEGIITIPAIEISAGGKTLLTDPIDIRVVKPLVSEDFKLRLTLSATKSYVGQSLVLTVKWYVNSNVAEFRFDLPFLEDQRFVFADHPEDSGYQGQDAIKLNLPGGVVIARKGQEELAGQPYTTVTLRRILIPREPGEFAIGGGMVFSKVITGYQHQGGRSPQDIFNRDFFDDFFGRRHALYQQLVTKSNELHLKVLALPEENRPLDFTGLVGQYSIAAEADPTEVNVGDPITLNIMVTGTEFLDNVTLPALEKQPGMRNNFKVPEEMGPGEIDGRVKVFTQTIRALRPSVKEIPSISLNYFNPETGKYEAAVTHVIPLQVHGTKIITAEDAEGITQGSAKSELLPLNKGIGPNYVGEDILENQDLEITSWLSSMMGLGIMLFPPAVYLLVLVPVYMKRRRRQNAETIQARNALPEFSSQLKGLEKEIDRQDLQQTVNGLVESMKLYLSRRLRMPPGALIYKDVADSLGQHGVEYSLLLELKNILDRCEAYQYGVVDKNAVSREKMRQILAAALALMKKIDQCLQK